MFYLDLEEIELNVFLGFFLEVIRLEDIIGLIIGFVLTSVNKFLFYGLVGKKLKKYLKLLRVFKFVMLIYIKFYYDYVVLYILEN